MKYFLLPLLAFSFILVASTAMAEPQCNDRDNVLALLAKKYQETPIAAGVSNAGALVEVLTDQKGETWTIIVTTPQGMSCLVAAGEGWRKLEAIALDPEA